MVDREKIIKGVHDARKYLEDREWVDKSVGVHIDALNDAISLLKEREAMVKPTKCPCGELFDAKDSSFCPKCGCAYGELSGRYTNIGR